MRLDCANEDKKGISKLFNRRGKFSYYQSLGPRVWQLKYLQSIRKQKKGDRFKL